MPFLMIMVLENTGKFVALCPHNIHLYVLNHHMSTLSKGFESEYHSGNAVDLTLKVIGLPAMIKAKWMAVLPPSFASNLTIQSYSMVLSTTQTDILIMKSGLPPGGCCGCSAICLIYYFLRGQKWVGQETWGPDRYVTDIDTSNKWYNICWYWSLIQAFRKIV